MRKDYCEIDSEQCSIAFEFSIQVTVLVIF